MGFLKHAGRLIGLQLALLLAFLSPLFAADLQVHIINVGQGDSILIVAPNGKKLLIDAGGHADKKSKYNPFNYIKALKQQNKISDVAIDYAILTHAHEDHCAGFAYLSKQEKKNQDIPIAEVYYSIAPKPNTVCWKSIQPLVGRARNTTYTISARGPPLDLGDDVKVSVLYPQEVFEESPSEVNDSSVIIKVAYKDVAVLLTGDASAKVERIVQDSRASILKVGHHGSRTATSAEFLDRVKPASGPFYAMISSNDKDGAGKTYGHPHKEALERLKAIPSINLCRTDIRGTIVMTTDGESVVIQSKKPGASQKVTWKPGKVRK